MKITKRQLKRIIREELESQPSSELEIALSKMTDDQLLMLFRGMSSVTRLDNDIFAAFAKEFTRRGIQPKGSAV